MGQFQIISRGGKTAATSVPPASCSLTADAVVVGGEPREGIIYLSLDHCIQKDGSNGNDSNDDGNNGSDSQ